MSNTQTSSTVNSQSSQTFPSILANSPKMVSNDDVSLQFSQFSTQIRLDKIIIGEIIEGSLQANGIIEITMAKKLIWACKNSRVITSKWHL